MPVGASVSPLYGVGKPSLDTTKAMVCQVLQHSRAGRRDRITTEVMNQGRKTKPEPKPLSPAEVAHH